MEAAKELGGNVWVVKAQIHAGGRGKGGGVKVARSLDEVKQYAGSMLGMTLVTLQTGPKGQVVRRLLIEQGVDIRKEFYVGMIVDRASRSVAVMASPEGGMNIEDVAAKTPEKIHKVFIDPIDGLTTQQADDISRSIGIVESSAEKSRPSCRDSITLSTAPMLRWRRSTPHTRCPQSCTGTRCKNEF